MSTLNDSHSSSAAGDMELIDYFRILSKRRLLIGGGTIGLVFLVGIASLLLPKTYASSVDLLVTGPTTQVEFTAQGEPRIETEFQPKVSIDTYRDLLYSHYIAQEVVNKLGLDKGADPITAQHLMDQVSVRAVAKTSLLRLTVEDREAESARALAQAWAELFVEQDRELNRRELNDIGSIIDGRLEETGQELRVAEEALQRFQEAGGVKQLERQIDNRIEQIVILEERLKELGVEKEKSQATLQQSVALLKTMSADSVDRQSGEAQETIQFFQAVRPAEPSATNPITAPLIMGSAKSPESIVVLGLQSRIVDNQIQMKALEAEEKQSNKSVEELRRELVVLKKQIASEGLKEKRLTRAVDTAQTTFDVLVKKAEEVKVAVATRPGTVKIAVPAFLPERHVRPRVRLNLVIAFTVGLILTMFIAFMLEYGERSRREP